MRRLLVFIVKIEYLTLISREVEEKMEHSNLFFFLESLTLLIE